MASNPGVASARTTDENAAIATAEKAEKRMVKMAKQKKDSMSVGYQRYKRW
jgi:hypothetical protein